MDGFCQKVVEFDFTSFYIYINFVGNILDIVLSWWWSQILFICFVGTHAFPSHVFQNVYKIKRKMLKIWRPFSHETVQLKYWIIFSKHGYQFYTGCISILVNQTFTYKNNDYYTRVTLYIFYTFKSCSCYYWINT